MAPVSLRLPPCSSIRHTNHNSQHTKNIHNRGRHALIPVSAVAGDGSLINVAASMLVISNKPSPVRHVWCVWCICCNSMQQDTCSNFLSLRIFFSQLHFHNSYLSYASQPKQTDPLKNSDKVRLITAHWRPGWNHFMKSSYESLTAPTVGRWRLLCCMTLTPR